MKKNKRRLARELALQRLFSLEFNETDDNVLLTFEEDQVEADMIFFELLVGGVTAQKDSIDALLKDHIAKRSLSRVDKVDLTILRIALYESVFAPEPTDIAVAIDEAIELAKEFGSETSYKFVNGVLDSYHKKTVN